MADTKTKILDSAERLFAESGIDGASLRAITEDAGVNLGSIYYYFKGKDDLVIEVLLRRTDEFNRRGRDRVGAIKKYRLRPTIREIWQIMIGSIMEFMEQNPDYMKFIQHLQSVRGDILLGAFVEKTLRFEEDLLDLLLPRFAEDRREKALARCQVLLQMLYQTMTNFYMVSSALNSRGIDLTNVQFVDRVADIAAASLQELIGEKVDA